MRSVLFGLAQLVAALAVAAGVYLLAGLAWSLVIVGSGVLVMTTIAEALPGALTRPVPPAPRRRRSPLED